MKKKLLILNGAHSDIPLINAAKKLGFYVITTGSNPDLIGHQYSDEYHQADFSDKAAILELAKKLNIDAICSCANDFGIITASYVAEQLNIPGHDDYQTTLKLHHKDRFKEFALKNNITTPKADSYDNILEASQAITKYQFPLIIKPVDLTGGKGVTIVNNETEYNNAITTAYNISPSKKIVIEEFIDGTSHSFSCFIINGKVEIYFSDNEYSYKNPFLISTSAAPAHNIEIVKEQLIKEAEKITELLKLKDGLFHIQYLLKDSKAWIIEITRRCSGDLYPHPVCLALNIDWQELIVRSEANMPLPQIKTSQSGFYGRHCIMAAQNGILEDVIIDDAIKENIADQLLWYKKGDIIDNFMIQKLGIFILKFSNRDEMDKKIKNINKYIKVKLSL